MTTLRTATLNLAASLPVGNPTRRKLLVALEDAQVTLSPGDILYSSWGYDQTNVDYYEVLKATAKQVVIQPLEKKVVSRGHGSENVVPLPGRFKPGSKKLRRKIQHYRVDEPGVSISSYAFAYLWDGKPKHQTAAGYGH